MAAGWQKHREVGVERWAESEKETNGIFKLSPHRQSDTEFLQRSGYTGRLGF